MDQEIPKKIHPENSGLGNISDTLPNTSVRHGKLSTGGGALSHYGFRVPCYVSAALSGNLVLEMAGNVLRVKIRGFELGWWFQIGGFNKCLV